jgi:hypothetical protein
MDRGHEPVHEAELVDHHLHHRHEAVRGAAGIRDDVMLRGVVLVVVDPHHDRDVFLLGRGRDHDLPGTPLEVLRRLIAIGEAAGGFEYQIDPQIFPRELGGILLCQDFDGIAVHHNGVSLRRDIAFVPAMDRVVLEKMGQRRGIGDVVHRHEVDVLGAHLLSRPHHVAPDPAEAVDPDLDAHSSSLPTNG